MTDQATVGRMLEAEDLAALSKVESSTGEGFGIELQKAMCSSFMQLAWGGERQESALKTYYKQPLFNQNFLTLLPPELVHIYGETSAQLFSRVTAIHDPIPADALRKALSFAYNAYSEEDDKGRTQREVIRKAASALNLGPLMTPDQFVGDDLQKLILKTDAPHPQSPGRTVPLNIALHMMLNNIVLPSQWLLQGKAKAYNGLVSAGAINENYLEKNSVSQAALHYHVMRSKWLELCVGDRILVEKYRDKVQESMSHVYHIWNDNNPMGHNSRTLIETLFNVIGMQILPLDELKRREVSWQEDIADSRNKRTTDHAKTY